MLFLCHYHNYIYNHREGKFISITFIRPLIMYLWTKKSDYF